MRQSTLKIFRNFAKQVCHTKRDAKALERELVRLSQRGAAKERTAQKNQAKAFLGALWRFSGQQLASDLPATRRLSAPSWDALLFYRGETPYQAWVKTSEAGLTIVPLHDMPGTNRNLPCTEKVFDAVFARSPRMQPDDDVEPRNVILAHLSRSQQSRTTELARSL